MEGMRSRKEEEEAAEWRSRVRLQQQRQLGVAELRCIATALVQQQLPLWPKKAKAPRNNHHQQQQQEATLDLSPVKLIRSARVSARRQEAEYPACCLTQQRLQHADLRLLAQQLHLPEHSVRVALQHAVMQIQRAVESRAE
jgi:hypothetical protein